MCSICFRRRSEGLGKPRLDRGSRRRKSTVPLMGVGEGKGRAKTVQAKLLP